MCSHNIVLFFNSFRIFAEAFHKRKTFFRELKSKYKNHVTIINYWGPIAILKSHLRPTELVFNWSISLDELGALQQQFSMYPKVSRLHVLRDSKSILNNISEQFTKLVSVKGLTSAVDIMIQTILQPQDLERVKFRDVED